MRCEGVARADLAVIPAKAGTSARPAETILTEVPAFAGMTSL